MSEVLFEFKNFTKCLISDEGVDLVYLVDISDQGSFVVYLDIFYIFVNCNWVVTRWQ